MDWNPIDLFFSLLQCISEQFGINVYLYNEYSELINYHSSDYGYYDIVSLIRSHPQVTDSWQQVSDGSGFQFITERCYAKRINANGDCILVLSPTHLAKHREQTIEEEENTYHELSVERDIHFTLSSLMAHSFLSIDCVSLRIMYCTTEIAAVCGFSMADLPTLTDLCLLDEEKTLIKRTFGELHTILFFTLRFMLHVLSASGSVICYKVFCVRVPSYFDASLALIDSTSEEHDHLCVEALNAWSSDSQFLIVCDLGEVIIACFDRSGLKKPDWNGKKLTEVDVHSGLPMEKLYANGILRKTRLKYGWMIESFVTPIATFSQEKPVETSKGLVRSLPSKLQRWVSESVTPTECICILLQCLEMQGKNYAIFKQSNHSVVQLMSTIDMSTFYTKSKPQSKGELFSVLETADQVLLSDNDAIIDNKKMGILWHLTKEHRDQLLQSLETTVFCPEIQTTLRKYSISHSLFGVEITQDIPYPLGILSSEAFYLVSMSLNPVMIVSPQLRVKYVNRVACEQFGIVINSSILDYFNMDSTTTIELISSLAVGQSTVICLFWKDSYQEEAYLSSFYALSQDDILVHCASYQAILNHHLYLQNSLKFYSLENMRLKRIMNIAYDGNCVIELQHLTILYPSYSMKQLFGCEERGSCFLQYVEESCRETFIQKMKELNVNGIPIFDYTTVMVTHNNYHYYQVIAIPIQLSYHYYAQAILCIKDVTRNVKLEQEEKKLHQAIERMNTLQSAMIEAAFDGSCIMDMRTIQPLQILHAFDTAIVSNIFLNKDQNEFSTEFRDHLTPYVTELNSHALHGIHIPLQSGIQLELNMVKVENNLKAMMSLRNITKEVEREENEIRLREEAQRANKNKRDFIVPCIENDSIGIYVS